MTIVFFIIIIVLIIFSLSESLLRIFWPQDVKVNHVNGLPLVYNDPVLGYVCHKNAHLIVKSPEFTAEYLINENGLRDQSVHSTSSSVPKLLLLGDSFTFGAGNNYDKIWAVILEQRLNESGHNVEVIKAGVPFHNTDNEVTYLERAFANYKPDFVILTFVPNNLFVNNAIKGKEKSPAKRQRQKVDLIGMNNKARGFHCLTFLKRIMIMNDLLYVLLYMMTSRAQFFTKTFNSTVRRQISITKELLAQMAQYCKKRGVPFIVLSIPQQFQVIAKAKKYKFPNLDVESIDATFQEFATQKEILWIASIQILADQYKLNRIQQYYRLDGHLNNNGNAIIAEHIFKSFVQCGKEKI